MTAAQRQTHSEIRSCSKQERALPTSPQISRLSTTKLRVVPHVLVRGKFITHRVVRQTGQ